MELGEAILEFPFNYREFDGAVEHTELTDIDRAVGSFFQSILQSLTIVDGKRKENEEFARFCARPPETKIYAGQFSDPQAFLKKLVSKSQKANRPRSELLPVTYIERDTVISFAEGDAYIDVSQFAELSNGETGEVYAVVNKSFVTLSYTLTALAWNRSTLERISLGLMMWARHQKKGRKHVFSAETMIAGAPVVSNIELTGLKETMSEPIEIDFESERLFASTLRFELIAEVYEAESVTERAGRIEVGGGVAYE